MVDALAWLRDLPSAVVPLLAAVIITAETALLYGVVLPGASAVLALGVLSHGGVLHPAFAAVVAAVAAVAGTQIAYRRGRRSTTRLPSSLRRIEARAARVLTKAGPTALAGAQWVVGIRTVTPHLAGRSGIRARTFTLVSVPTAIAWGVAWVVAGNAAGSAYQEVSRWLGAATGLLAVVVLAGVLAKREFSKPRGADASSRTSLQVTR